MLDLKWVELLVFQNLSNTSNIRIKGVMPTGEKMIWKKF